MKYGSERMAKHAEAIWPLVKDAILLSPQESVLSFCPESLDGPGHFQNEIADGALAFLETAVRQNDALFLDLILGDADVNQIKKNMSCCQSYTEISSKGKQRLHAVGCILAVSAKTSIASCNRVFESIFPSLLEALGSSVRDPSWNHPHLYDLVVSEDFNFGALFLGVLLLESFRDLIVGSEKCSTLMDSISEACCGILQGFSAVLARAFSSTLARNNYQEASHPCIYLSGNFLFFS